MKQNLYSCYLLSLFWLFTFSDALSSRPQINITRTDVPPVIDGILSEDTWTLALPVTEFLQRIPDNGEFASQKTEVFLLYDKHYIYIGIRCYDDPDKIIGREMGRDSYLYGLEDRVVVILDTHLDGRNGYWFEMGPRGAKSDAIISDNGAVLNRLWQGIWEGKSSIQPHGWEVEIAIPFKTLNFDQNQPTWGVKFIRDIKRRLEFTAWPGSSLNNSMYQVSDAGLLTGLDNISQGAGLNINPYTIAGHNYQQATDGSYLADAGVDVFYQLTSGIRAVLTLNTDFADTEVDARQINLTRFSLHFPEKRDFFLDGANYFNFGIGGNRLIPFFSRRLGLDSNAEPLPIYAGGRVTGQIEEWNLGFLNIFQEKVYDNNNYSAMRVTRNIGNYSSAGMIATMGNAVGKGSNALYGLDTKIATSSFAGNKNLAFVAYGLQSITEEPGSSRSTDNAFGAQLSYPNDKFSLAAGFLQIDDGFTAGMGFIPRKGIREFYWSSGVAFRPYVWGMRHIGFNGNIDLIYDLNGNLQTREIGITPLWFYLISGEYFGFQVQLSHENLNNDFNLMDRILIPADEYDFMTKSFTLSSSTKKMFQGSFTYNWGGFYNGAKKSFNLNTGLYAFGHLFLGVETENSFIRFPENDIDLGIYRAIIRVFLNPDINLSSFIQYDDFSETAGWQSRFRWIIKPGREILLTWNSNIQHPMERFTFSERSLRFKLKYNIRF